MLQCGRGVRHQIYDMLFILFELAAKYGDDLDSEWASRWEYKQVKYVRKEGV